MKPEDHLGSLGSQISIPIQQSCDVMLSAFNLRGAEINALPYVLDNYDLLSNFQSFRSLKATYIQSHCCLILHHV